jgi:hypothetical protein
VLALDFTGEPGTTTITRMDGDDLADDTFVAAPPAVVARIVADPGRWGVWWPDLELAVTLDRGVQGRQWRVGGALTGTAEIWLEPVGDGTVVHFYLRAALDDRARAARARSWKRSVHAVKDELEQGRAPGTPVRRSRW